MKSALPFALLATLLLAAACGGGSSAAPGSTAVSEAIAAAPSMQSVEMSVTPFDDAPTTSPPPIPLPIAGCNPHLFVRAEEIVKRVNRHVFKVLVHVEDAIASDRAPATSGATVIFDGSRRGVDAELSVTRTGDATFSWMLLLKKTRDSTFTEVASGHLDRTGAAGPHQGKGDMALDLGKVAAVTGEEVAGVLSVAFESFPDRRLVSAHAAGVVWDTDAISGFARTPRDADFVFLREPGKGGSLKVSEDAALSCPLNPVLTRAHLDLVNRWFLPPGAGVHGRSDAAMTGGQLTAAGIAVIEGLTCHQSATPMAMPAEGEWLLKAEDAAGKTLWGRELVVGATPCDPLLNPPSGAVPSLADNKTDFDFSGIHFGDGKPYPFPGM